MLDTRAALKLDEGQKKKCKEAGDAAEREVDVRRVDPQECAELPRLSFFSCTHLQIQPRIKLSPTGRLVWARSRLARRTPSAILAASKPRQSQSTVDLQRLAVNACISA